MTKQNAIHLFFSITAGIMLITSCDTETEKLPSFMSIDSIGVIVTNPLHGTANHNIKDAWVYIDGNILGAYELPARFPVLKEGMHEISIASGIYDNGISATREKYPFYNFYKTQVNFVPGEEVKIPLATVNYNTLYSWYSDFELNTSTFGETPASESLLEIQSNEVFEGSYSGRFVLNSAESVFDGEQQTPTNMSLAQATYLEMNYKAEQQFSVGVTITESGGSLKRVYVATINSSDTWNKIYINLSKPIKENYSDDNYRVYIYATLEPGRNESKVYLDNLKLIHN